MNWPIKDLMELTPHQLGLFIHYHGAKAVNFGSDRAARNAWIKEEQERKAREW